MLKNIYIVLHCHPNLRGVVTTGQTYEMELFVEIINDLKTYSIFPKKLHLRCLTNFKSAAVKGTILLLLLAAGLLSLAATSITSFSDFTT